MQAYKSNLSNYLLAKKQKLETEPELDEEKIRQVMMLEIYDQQRQFAEEEVAHNNKLLDEAASTEGKGFFGKLSAKKSSVLRKWSNLSTGKKITAGAVVGVGAGVFSATLGLGLAGVAVASGAKFSLGLLNRRASLRNVSQKSLEQELKRINASKEEAKRSFDAGNADLASTWGDYRGELLTKIESDLDGRVQHAQRRNRVGNALLALSGVSIAYGAAGLAGADLPDWRLFNFGGGHHQAPNTTPSSGSQPSAGTGSVPLGPPAPGDIPGSSVKNPGNVIYGVNHINMNGFKPSSFYGRTPHEAVGHMFGVLRDNNIRVQGLTPEKINAIVADMKANHWQVVGGMKDVGGHLRQNLGDVHNTWVHGHTANTYASGQQGLGRESVVVGHRRVSSSVRNWAQFTKLAARHGVTISRA
jgi:hypothetical protein